MFTMNSSKDSEKIFPASKRIAIGTTSSLVDLKAELFRRKAEAVNKVKDVKAVASSSKNEKWKTQAEKLEAQGKMKEIKPERKLIQEPEPDSQLNEDLRKSREALERKTKIYEERFNQAIQNVSKGSSDSEDDDEDNPELVNFKEKVFLERLRENRNAIQSSPKHEYDDCGGDWVEFVDSLGRTRKCLKQDLDHYKKLDEETSNIHPPEEPEQDAQKDSATVNYENFIREQLQYEDRESEEPIIGPVHYRDVQKDEVREHGVGYFAFSSDDIERKKQRDLLDNLRNETKKSRVEVVRLKQRRKQQKRDRLRKIAERKGIPFNENDVKSSDSDDSLDFKPKSAFDSLSARDREVEQMKQLLTREWDVGKKDDDGRTVRPGPDFEIEETKSKKESKISHKDYVKSQREERKQEFAPPTFYYDNVGSTTNNDDNIQSMSMESKGFNSHPSTKKFKCSTSSSADNHSDDFKRIIDEKLKLFKNNS